MSSRIKQKTMKLLTLDAAQQKFISISFWLSYLESAFRPRDPRIAQVVF
jgi:hypothetical protein